MVTGDQIWSIALSYRVGESTVKNIIAEVCAAIAIVLGSECLILPSEEKWKLISSDFLYYWNIPNCLGAIDGKHFQIQAPANSGSDHFNHKNTFSLIMLAVCDANYKFTFVQIGDMGSKGDAAIFADSPLSDAVFNPAILNLPKGIAPLPGYNNSTPCYFVGDDAFPLSTRIMKPYPGSHLEIKKKIFNYRLSRARRTIENAFGILVSRFRVFRKPIALDVNLATSIIHAGVCLHNFIKERNDAMEPSLRRYSPPEFFDWEDASGAVYPGKWREDNGTCFIRLKDATDNALCRAALYMREMLANYFQTPNGQVPWQSEYVQRICSKS